MTSSQVWGTDAATHYDDPSSAMFSRAVLDRTTGFLAELADGGPALEFAIGTGRVAVPLHERGVPVVGIELSEPMVAELRKKADAATIPVTVGDMATTRVDGTFPLVYLVYNTIGNLLTQAEQVECFQNAARHLAPGGRFVIELGVPDLRLLPPGQDVVPFHVTDDHLGFDVYDTVTQRLTSQHYWRKSGRSDHTDQRYIWPSECDLMAKIAGLEFEDRFADWDRSPFTSDSGSHVSVWRKPAPVVDQL